MKKATGRTDPLRVLLLAPVNAPSGGIATWSRQWLRHHGDAVVLNSIDTSRTYLELGSTSVFRRALLGALTSLRRWTNVRRAINSGAHDLIYITCAPSAGFWFRDLPLISVLSRRIAVVVHLHGGDVAGFFGGRWTRRLSRCALGNVGAIICITREVRDAATNLVPHVTVVQIPNMLSRDLPPQDHLDGTDRAVLHVGWQSEAKGTFDVLEVARRLPDVAFVLVGPIATDVQRVLDAYFAANGRPNNVVFTGELTGEALEARFRSASVFLFPSQNEGFPMVVLEAMSHSLPVVASDVGAITEILAMDSETPAGVTTPVGTALTVSRLATLVTGFLDDDELRSTVGANGRRRVEKQYVPAAVVPTLEDTIWAVPRKHPTADTAGLARTHSINHNRPRERN